VPGWHLIAACEYVGQESKSCCFEQAEGRDQEGETRSSAVVQRSLLRRMKPDEALPVMG
jgi:hypothetical protein